MYWDTKHACVWLLWPHRCRFSCNLNHGVLHLSFEGELRKRFSGNGWLPPWCFDTLIEHLPDPFAQGSTKGGAPPLSSRLPSRMGLASVQPSSIKHQAQASSIKHQEPSIKHQASSIKPLIVFQFSKCLNWRLGSKSRRQKYDQRAHLEKLVLAKHFPAWRTQLERPHI